MRFFVSSIIASIIVAYPTFVKSMKNGKNEQAILNSAEIKTTADTSLPTGDYSQSCESCTMVPGNNPKVTTTLSCQCYNADGSLNPTSFLGNAWACDGCVNNNNGDLVCQLPVSSNTNGYQSVCAGCGVSGGVLRCVSCNGVTPSIPYSLHAACGCESVSFINNVLVCVSTSAPTAPTGTKAPTQPTLSPGVVTNSPTQPTKSPTPNAAPTTCESYWLTLSATGEKAPYKPCSNGSFTNSNGCQYQNYCCWQPTSSTNPQTVGTCAVPNGVPVDCPLLTTQSSCNQYSTYCSWNPNYGTSGLCQRRCPGDPVAMCALG